MRSRRHTARREGPTAGATTPCATTRSSTLTGNERADRTDAQMRISGGGVALDRDLPDGRRDARPFPAPGRPAITVERDGGDAETARVRDEPRRDEPAALHADGRA